MGLNADEKKLLEELSARASEPDADDDYEIEIYDTSAGKGARVPYRTGKGWLHSVFGIGTPDAPATGEGGTGEGEGSGEGGKGAGKGGAKGGAYFGRKP